MVRYRLKVTNSHLEYVILTDLHGKNVYTNVSQCYVCMYISSVRRGLRGFNPPPHPKFRRPSKIVPKSTRLWKLLKIAEFRTPTPQDVRKKGSKILKLLSVRNCFTVAMTNKLVVIINSLKVPKIKNSLVYEMKFLYQITAASRTPD